MFLAHINENGKTQTIQDHLNGTAKLCSQFASAFGAEEQGEQIGLAHDLGKYSDAFQQRLRGGSTVDHSTAGAVECMERKNVYGAFCVAGHHGGLPDGGTVGDLSDQPTLLGRKKKAEEKKIIRSGILSSETVSLQEKRKGE